MTSARIRALLCCLLAGTAWAQAGEAEVKRLEAMHVRAVASFDALEYDAARATLEEALAAAAAAGMSQAPIAARLHITLGVVLVGGMRDRYRAFQEMLAAARIDPAAEVDAAIATLEAQELLQSARDALAAQALAARRRSGADAAAGAGQANLTRGLAHDRIDDAWAGFDIPLRCELGADVPATRVLLFYRPSGREDFASAPMRERDGAWSASIPEAATRGRYVHYYLEARDRRGRAVAQDGSAASPNLISVRGLNPRAPAANRTPTAQRIALGRRWTAGLGAGSGVGILGATKSENCGANPMEGCTPIDVNHPAVPIDSGAAWSPLHLIADAGYRLTPAWEVAAQLRFQVISGNEIKEFDRKAFLGTARVRRWFGSGATRLFFSGAAGAGQVVHAVDLGPDGGSVRDTVASGILAIGGGMGVARSLTSSLALVGAVDMFVLFPEQTAFHADVNVGLRYAF